MSRSSRPFVAQLFAAVLALSLSLHVFNMGGEEGLKPFHFAAVIASVMTLLYVRKDKQFVLLRLFLICVAFSAIISPVSHTLSGFVNVLIVTLCCYGVSMANVNVLLKWLVFLIPADLMALAYEAVTNPVYRFQGFYNDPNYLCTTLIVFFFLSILAYYRFENLVLRVISIVNIVIIVILVLITLSRTGLACIVLLLAISFASVVKRHLYKGIIILVISACAINHYATDFIDKEYTLLYERLFERSDNLESAGELRSELAKQNIRFIIDNPSYLLFGLGPSATAGDNAKQVPGLIRYRKSRYRDHNSWTSCFSEYGLFAFVLFFLLVFGTVKRVIKMKHSVIKYICIGTCLSIIIFSLSIWQMTYLPFWWGLFLLGNKQLQVI